MALARVLLRRPDFTLLYMAEEIILLDCARTENATGAFTCVLPIFAEARWVGVDTLLEVQRSFDGGATWVNDMQTIWFVRSFAIEYTEGRETAVLSGHDSMGLLDRRVVAWFAVENTELEQDYYSIKHSPACDALRAVVRENFTTKIFDGAEDYPGSVSVIGAGYRVMGNVVVEPDDHGGPIIHCEIAWKNTSDALRDIVDAAADLGMRILFDLVVDIQAKTFTFQVWRHQRGVNRNTSLVFSLQNGNLNQLRMTLDFTQEATWAHIGGEGQAAERLITAATTDGFNEPTIIHLRTAEMRLGVANLTAIQDGEIKNKPARTVRLKPAALRIQGQPYAPLIGPKADRTERFMRTPFYPIEVFVDGSGDMNSEPLMRSRGLRELRKRAPRWVFAAQAIDTPEVQFGRDYGFGDSVAIRHRSQTSYCRIKTFRLRYENGYETVEIPLESEEAL